MLIRFTVENFLSFNQRTEFTMVASPDDNHRDHVVQEDNKESIGLLRTSLIYGATNAGKSNLIKAMKFAQDFIVDGVDKNKNIKVSPFKRDQDSLKKPSRFEFEFKHHQKQYAYGFIIDSTQVYEEWLFEIGINQEKSIYERNGNDYQFNFKHSLFRDIKDKEKTRIEFESESTRQNLLFLTNCKERRIEYFENIYNWFSNVLTILFPESKPFALPLLLKDNEKLLNQGFLKKFNKLLKSLDLGIEKVDINEIDLEKYERIPLEVKEMIQEEFPYHDETANAIFILARNKDSSLMIRSIPGSKALKVMKLVIIKHDKNKKEVLFEIEEESDGTQRIIDLIPMLFKLSQGDVVFVVDEIERSLHVLLARKIFEIFLNFEIENQNQNDKLHNSQLIATTHQAILLDIKELFRKDEIWFIGQDKHGQSIAYSLANTDVENLDLAKGYINGRFGAIHSFPEIKNDEEPILAK